MKHDATLSDDVELWLFQMPKNLLLSDLNGAEMEGSVIKTKAGVEYDVTDRLKVDEIINAFGTSQEDDFSLGKVAFLPSQFLTQKPKKQRPRFDAVIHRGKKLPSGPP